jgi:hypothetical protein
MKQARQPVYAVKQSIMSMVVMPRALNAAKLIILLIKLSVVMLNVADLNVAAPS